MPLQATLLPSRGAVLRLLGQALPPLACGSNSHDCRGSPLDMVWGRTSFSPREQSESLKTYRGTFQHSDPSRERLSHRPPPTQLCEAAVHLPSNSHEVLPKGKGRTKALLYGNRGVKMTDLQTKWHQVQGHRQLCGLPGTGAAHMPRLPLACWGKASRRLRKTHHGPRWWLRRSFRS